jgi:hypothetical protein
MISKHKKQEKTENKNDCKTVEQIREHLLKYTKDKGRDWSRYTTGVMELLMLKN